MSKYKGAEYIGIDPIHLADGTLILNGEITDLLSEEAAINDNMFQPVYGEIKKKVEKKIEKQYEPEKKSKKRGKK